MIACVAGLAMAVIHAQEQAQTPASASAASASPAAGGTMTPIQRADSAPKGSLKNPYQDSDAAAIAAGKTLYFNFACSGCHGGSGGGGMCPPTTDGVWIYGGDDDTLFRLVAYGSQVLQGKGYSRQAQENIVAPMPAMGSVVKTDDDLWHILAFIRSNYHGPPECKMGCKGN